MLYMLVDMLVEMDAAVYAGGCADGPKSIM